MKLSFAILFVIILTNGFACREPSTGFGVPDLSLVADPGAVDCCLQVTTTSSFLGDTLQVSYNNQIISSVKLSATEAVVFIDSLLPNHSYQMAAKIISSGRQVEPQTSIVFTTLDTTSHDITWEIDTLGDRDYSNSLRDVSIVNDSLVYVAGALYQRDNSGQIEFETYGVASLAGQRDWSYQRVRATEPSSIPANLRPGGIITISSSEIWMADGGVFRWDGVSVEAQAYWINPFSGNPNSLWSDGQLAVKLLATRAKEIYAYGPKGALAYYNNHVWQKVESGTNLMMQDVCTIENKNRERQTVIAVASDDFANNEKKLLLIEGAGVQTLPDSGLPWSLHGVASTSANRCIVVGDGLYWKRGSLTDQRTMWTAAFGYDFSPYYLRDVDGQANNDVFAVGDFGEVLHYNGATWKSYIAETGLPTGTYSRVVVKGNLVVAVGVGINFRRGIVLRGMRH